MSITGFGEWLETPRGRYLLAWEARKLDLHVADIFGFHAVQLGLCEVDFLRANRISCRFKCATDIGAATKVNVCASAEELPFASQSLDLVLLPHALEFADHPHLILREVERVLLPEGHLIISGFNPFSLWGMRRALAGNLGEIPWQGQYLSVRRLKDWLSLLGFETRLVEFGCFAPPMASETWLRRWSFMEAAGERWWSLTGGAYVLQAVKRVPGMRLIMPNWRESLRHRKAMVPVIQKTTEKQWNKPN